MEGAETFIEQWRDPEFAETDFNFGPVFKIDSLKEVLEDSISAAVITVAIFKIKPKPCPVIITGEDIDGQTILITEKI